MKPFKTTVSYSLRSSASKKVRATAKVSGALLSRSIFKGRLQADGESVQEFANALKTLALECQYTSRMLNEQIRDQLIFGLKSKAIQDKIYFEKDNSVKLKEVMSIAIAGEAFQLFRFGNQHPLANKEIQDLLGPHLDQKTLLEMRTVSKGIALFANEELGRRHRQNLRAIRWSPDPCNDSFQETEDLYFQSASKICTFIKLFKKRLNNRGSLTGWPFFASGIVQFNYESVSEDEDQDDYHYYGYENARDEFVQIVIEFLEMFGSQLAVLIWRNGEETTPCLYELKTMLEHTPNLKHLWVEERLSDGDDDFLGDTPWPALAHLDSVHSCSYDNFKNDWVVEPLLMTYGSTLTALNVGTSSLNIPALIKQYPCNRSFLLPLSNVRDLTIESEIGLIRRLVRCTGWKLRKLSLHIDSNSSFAFEATHGRFNDLNNYVKKFQLVWSLLNQSSKSLEEVYLDIGHRCWNDFIRLFLLPAFHNRDISRPCTKVRKLVIPSIFLLRAKQVLEVFCKKFPNVKRIQFTYWRADLTKIYEDFKENNLKYADALPELVRNLYFKAIDINVPNQLDPFTEETFVHFWNGLASLQEITVLEGSHVVYKQIRNYKAIKFVSIG